MPDEHQAVAMNAEAHIREWQRITPPNQAALRFADRDLGALLQFFRQRQCAIFENTEDPCSFAQVLQECMEINPDE